MLLSGALIIFLVLLLQAKGINYKIVYPNGTNILEVWSEVNKGSLPYFASVMVLIAVSLLLFLVHYIVTGVPGSLIYSAYSLLVLLFSLNLPRGNIKAHRLVEDNGFFFTPLFLFSTLGPFMCAFYMMIWTFHRANILNSLLCATLIKWVRLLPALITSFILGLVGDFSSTWSLLQSKIKRKDFDIDGIIVDSVNASVGNNYSTDEIDLFYRAKLAWVILAVFFSIIFWSI